MLKTSKRWIVSTAVLIVVVVSLAVACAPAPYPDNTPSQPLTSSGDPRNFANDSQVTTIEASVEVYQDDIMRCLIVTGGSNQKSVSCVRK